MAKWNKLIITDAGYQLSARTLAEQKIQYTHAQTTDKDMSAMTSDELKALTSLGSVVQDLPVGTISVQDDHTVNVPVKVTNQDLTTDYLLYGLALFAKPVDGDEILYGILTASKPDLIPASAGTTVTGTNFKLKVHVGDAANVNIVISPDGSVSNDELEGILKSYVATTDLDELLKSKKYATEDYVDDKVATAKPNVYPFTASDGSAKVVVKSGENMEERLKELSKTVGSGTIWVEKGVTSSTSPDVSVGSYTCDGKELYAILGTAYRAYSIFATADSCKVVKLFAEADLTDRLNGLKQAILDQASENAKTIAEKAVEDGFTKRNAPAYWWDGTQEEFDKINPKNVDWEYSIYGGSVTAGS